MEIQRQQDAQDQQFRQQQEQQSQQFQQGQSQRGQQQAAQPTGPSARQIWEKHTLVPPDHNALLGRWTTHAADTVGPKDSPLGDIISGRR